MEKRVERTLSGSLVIAVQASHWSGSIRARQG